MRKEKRVVEIQKEVTILQDDHRLILEKGDKIQILKESILDKRAVQLFKDQGFITYMEYRFGGPVGYYDQEGSSVSEIGEAIIADLAYILNDISADNSWAEQVLLVIAENIKRKTYR